MPWVCLGGRAASNHRPRPLLHLRDLFLMPAGGGSWNFELRSSFTLMQLFVGFQFFSVSYEIILFEFFVLLCLVVASKCFSGSDDKQTRPRFLLCSFFCNRAPSSPPHLLLSSSHLEVLLLKPPCLPGRAAQHHYNWASQPFVLASHIPNFLLEQRENCSCDDSNVSERSCKTLNS